MFKDKVVVITGSSHGIGKCTKEEFEKAGAIVCTIDIEGDPYFTGDIGKESVVRAFAEKVISDYGYVDYLIKTMLLPSLKGSIPVHMKNLISLFALALQHPFF